MLRVKESDLETILQAEYQKGIKHGIKLMKEKMLAACRNRSPIEINDRVYFVQSDIQHLRSIMEGFSKR